MSEDLLSLIAQFTEALNGEATPEELEDIRDKIDSYKFRQNVRVAL